MRLMRYEGVHVMCTGARAWLYMRSRDVVHALHVQPIGLHY